MECIFEVRFDGASMLALLSLILAALSALYAHTTWREAKKANQISVLSHKKEIFDAFFELKMHMTQKAQFADLGEVSKFYYQSKNAKIYFPSPLAQDIENYFDACFCIADIHRTYNGISKESSTEYKKHIETEKELAPKIESDILKILKEAHA